MKVPWMGLVFSTLAVLSIAQDSPYDWQGYDRFDQIDDRMNAVNLQNCHSKPATELHLPQETLAQLPQFNKLLTTIIYANRTNLLHLHNMALNRAFYYSYIFQKLNETEQFEYQPGLMYHYFSTAADVSANEYNINGSAIFYDNNVTYANWYRNLKFNDTLPLFGPRAFRYDDYNDPTNWLREPTNETIDIVDYGAGPQSNYTVDSYKINEWYDYFLPDGKDKEGLDSVRKHSYDVGIMYSNETGKFETNEFEGKTFFGPPSPGQAETEYLPVVYTEPYYDCGRSNKWIVSAVSPIVDQLPRYLEWFHLRRFQFVAVSVLDIDFLSIDINPCPLSIGNEPPNFFENTARCKSSTMCEPLPGWGFRRGGYKCMCKPGYRYPPWQNGPFMGADIESATEEEYEMGFDCLNVGLRQVLPIIRGNETVPTFGNPTSTLAGRKKRAAEHGKATMPTVQLDEKLYKQPAHVLAHDRAARDVHELSEPLRSNILNKKRRFLRSVGLTENSDAVTGEKTVVHAIEYPEQEHVRTRFVARYKRDEPLSRQKRSQFNQDAHDRMEEIFNHKDSVNADNCASFKEEDLHLPGDVSFGVEVVFSPQARIALRLSHFLSNFLQNIDMYEEYGNLRGDKFLNIEQIFGEALANVMGDLKVKGSGVFYDIDKFVGPGGKTRQFFGPYAYRYEEGDNGAAGPGEDRANTHFRAIDYAGYADHYLDEPWFKNVKERWQSNTYGLTKFTEKPMIRSDLAGSSLRKFELYPLYYYAPKEEDGWWSAPYFDCDGHVNEWVVTYAIPFFGQNAIGSAIEFKGVVIVDAKLDELDVNQCPMEYHVPNAFKDTARCDFTSTYCEALQGKRFTKGAYKCNCRQGYEYPFNDNAWYFDGQTMEEEWRKLEEGDPNSRYDTLKCRIGAASHLVSNWWLLVAAFTLLFHSH